MSCEQALDTIAMHALVAGIGWALLGAVCVWLVLHLYRTPADNATQAADLGSAMWVVTILGLFCYVVALGNLQDYAAPAMTARAPVACRVPAEPLFTAQPQP